MARKYTREELRERLRRSVYKVVTEDGIEGVTVRKVHILWTLYEQ